MAFAALKSLEGTMECFANFSPTFSETLNFSFKEMDFLNEVIKYLDNSRKSESVKALDRQIQKAVHEFEDVVDSVHANMILISQSDQSIANERRSMYVEEVRQGFNSFVEKVKMIKKGYCEIHGEEKYDVDEHDHEYADDDDDHDHEYVDEEEEEDDDGDEVDDYDQDHGGDDDDDDDDDESSRSDFGGKKLKLVGVSDQLAKIKDRLTAASKSYELGVISFVGVAGTGRSNFAKTIFDEANRRHQDAAPLFKLRAWVSVGPKYEFKEILVSILYQTDDYTGNVRKLARKGDKQIFKYLYSHLKSQRYLIVLDGVWETRVWAYLEKLFPDENNGSRVFITTHLEEVALFAKSSSIYRTRPLKKEESWNLLSTLLFPKRKSCPPKFEKAGKKIAENCGGLHVEVAKVAILLSKVGKKPEHWKKVAAEMENYVAKDAFDEMLEISKITGDDILPKGGSARILKEVLGLSYEVIRDVISKEFLNRLYPNLKVVALVGMAGIGKTALARKIYEDPWTLGCYKHRVWLTLGPEYRITTRIWADILAQLDPDNEYKMHMKEDETSAKDIIRSILSGKRCLVVLDDVWGDKVWRHGVGRYLMLLKDIKCEVLLTTRLMGVLLEYFGTDGSYNEIHTIPFLNKEESWNLLRERVFGEGMCPYGLEKAGKMIAEECDGLPLTIVTVASLLSKADEKTPEYWNEVAEKKNSVFEDAYRKISKVLYPSYRYLRLEDRSYFLYMAAFRLKYEIPISMLFMLCTAEGLFGTTGWDSIRDFTSIYLENLASESLVLIHDKKYDGQAKTCRLHSVFWHFCVREASNDKFLHVVNRYADGLAEDVEFQRRLCIQNNVLFAIKDVYNSMASLSTARSLLCFGPPHPYQVPIFCNHLKLLKVLDALAIRLYEFPDGIFKLVLLRYLALTYNGKISDSISKLWNLEFLNIQQHMSIRFPGDSFYLPTEIWDMKELKHLQIMGRNLPEDPRKSRARLEKLSTLSDVRAESVTKSILERIPNLSKLGIRIELEPIPSKSSLSFDCTSHLKRLKSLKCVVVNPELKSELVAPPSSFSKLPNPVNKLSLSGLGYSWEHMRPIASLPYLLVLKLKCYAFRGAEWIMHEGDFSNLQYLLLEDTDLVHWRADNDYYLLKSLQLLIIRNCFKLKDIPWQCLPESCKVELVDCNPSALQRIPENYSVRVYCSWEDKNSRAGYASPKPAKSLLPLGAYNKSSPTPAKSLLRFGAPNQFLVPSKI